MLIRSLLAMAVGGVAVWTLTANKQARLDRERASSRKPPPEHTWEDEGGALPVTGAQLGPAPVLP